MMPSFLTIYIQHDKVYYGFYCAPIWQVRYMILDCGVLVAGAVVAWFGGGASSREFWTRTIGFTFLTAMVSLIFELFFYFSLRVVCISCSRCPSPDLPTSLFSSSP